jgi:hypothetical protein
VKFILFVEGHTEKQALAQFMKRWLDPQLPQPVGIKVVRFRGWQNYVDDVAMKAELTLAGNSGTDVIAVIGLLDLYGPKFYPENATTADEKYEWGKKHIEQKVGKAKFRQHFAVHETEAWLLSDPSVFPDEVRTALPRRPPETVNFNKPPAKILEHVYQNRLGRSYRKVIDGSNIFFDLSPDAAYKQCPRLRVLLDEMLQLARARY